MLYELAVPESLAEILLTKGVARKGFTHRSGVIEIISASLDAVGVAITLAQGPLTVQEWFRILRQWGSTKTTGTEGSPEHIVISDGETTFTTPDLSDPAALEAAHFVVELLARRSRAIDKGAGGGDDIF